MAVHVAEPKQLSSEALALLFNEARTHNAFVDKPVPEELLRRAVDLAKMAPTSANQSPFRVVFLRSKAAKQRLAPALMPGNLEKTLAAPVVAIIGYDLKFYEHLPFLFPHADAKSWFSAMRPSPSAAPSRTAPCRSPILFSPCAPSASIPAR